MPSDKGTAKRSRDAKDVLRPATRPCHQMISLDAAGHRDGYRRASRSGSLTSDDPNSEALGCLGKALVERFPIGHGTVLRREDGNKRMEGFAAHRGHVAQSPAKRLPPHSSGFLVGGVMHTLDNAIGFQEKHHSIARPFHDSTIVAGADNGISSEGKVRQKDFEQPILAEIPKLHFARSGHASVKTTVIALKSECMRMAAQRDPVPS